VSYRSKIDEEERPDAHVNDLLARLEAARSHVVALHVDRRIASVRLWVVQYANTSNPGISFEASTVARVAGFGLGLDIDPYVVDDDDEDPDDN
jgi:hypothetical protein